MPDIAYTILSVICALFIVAALFTDPATDEDIGYQFIGALIFLPIIALAVAGFSFILPFLLSALGILALVSIGLALLYLLWKLLDTNFMRGIFHELFKGIGNMLKLLWNTAKKLLGELWSILKAFFAEVFNALKNLPRILKNLFQFLWALIKNPLVALKKLLNFLGKVFRGLWNSLKAIGRWLKLLIKSPLKALSLLWKGLRNILSGVGQFLKGLMKLPGIVGKFFRGIAKILDTIGDVLSTLARFIGGILGFIGDIITGIFSMLWNAAPWMRPILSLLAKTVKMIAGWFTWLWLLLLLPFFLLFRRRNTEDDEKKNTIYVQVEDKTGHVKYILPAKKVPTVLQGVSDDLIDILNSTHKHIRHIKNH